MVLIKGTGWKKEDFICVLPPWSSAYRGLLVPAARAKALCVKESITFQPCKGLQQMSALQTVESLSPTHTRTHTYTHTHTLSLLEVLSVKAGVFCLVVHI